VRDRIEGVFHKLTDTGRDLEVLLAKTIVGLYPGPASLPLVLSVLVRIHSGKGYLWKFLGKQPRHESGG
jgi:hypothetical protein